MTYVWLSVAVYLLIGALVSWAVYDREEGGWIWSVLLWPLVVVAFVVS